MNRAVSVQLDLLRWIAAVSVFVSHFSYLGLNDGVASEWESFGRVGVIVFFVLSGYVIAYVAHEKHGDIDDYALARLARLYSVYVPALVLTVILDVYGRHMNGAVYGTYPVPTWFNVFKKLPVFMTFMQENSLFSSRWFSNGPLWSIAYEFWYYAIYAAAFYLTGSRRLLLVAICVIFAGWKVLLLFPLWLAGVLVYNCRARIKRQGPYVRQFLIVAGSAGLLAVVSPPGYALLEGLRTVGKELTGIGLHAYFLSDYVCAIPMVLLLSGLVTLDEVPYPKSVVSVIRFFAGFSFSLYVFHVPMILFARAAGYYDPGVPLQCAAIFAAIVASIYLLTFLSESRKSDWYGFLNGRYKMLMAR